IATDATNSLAIGSGATILTGGDHSLALGSGSRVDAEGSIALGSGSVVDRDYVLSVGSGVDGDAFKTRIIANVGAGVQDNDAVNLGQLNSVIDQNKTRYYSVNSSTQQGNYNNDGATGLNSMAAGINASAIGEKSAAFGFGATSTGIGSLALGTDSKANFNSSVAIGAGSIADLANTVSVGSVNNTRQITYVTAGTADTDAVNYAQLKNLEAIVSGITSGGTNNNSFFAALGGADGNNPQAISAGFDSVAAGAGAAAQQLGSIAIGAASSSSGVGSIAIGYNTESTSNAVALGNGAKAQDNSVALGSGSIAEAGTVSVGRAGQERKITNVAKGTQDTDAVNLRQLNEVDSRVSTINTTVNTLVDKNKYVAVNSNGSAASATILGSLAIGGGAIANAGNSIAIGENSTATEANTVAFGSANNLRRLTFVGDALNNNDAVNLGQVSRLLADVSMHYFSVNSSPNLGNFDNNGAIGINSMALGANATSSGMLALAVGFGAQATAPNSIAIGSGSIATQANTFSIGSSGNERQITHVAKGTALTDAVNVSQLKLLEDEISKITSQGTGNNSLFAANQAADNQNTQATVIGAEAVAAGSNASASGVGAIAIGGQASSSGNGSLSIGYKSEALGNGIAVGQDAYATNDSLALGQGANAANNSVALGKNSVATEGTVSVGSAGNERRITNVADAIDDTDAINKKTLTSSINNIKTEVIEQLENCTNGCNVDLTDKNVKTNSSNSVVANASGTNTVSIGGASLASGTGSVAIGENTRATGTNSVALGQGSIADRSNVVSIGSSGNERILSNVARGERATDAINKAQFDEFRFETSSEFSQLRDDLNTKTDKLEAGVASAMAMAGIPQAYRPDSGSMGIAAGGYGDKSALAFGLSSISKDGVWSFKVQGSTNSEGEFGGSLGVGYHW
ncbi:YadA family autotransporter adhesin, partial [Thorsellia kenyensis]